MPAWFIGSSGIVPSLQGPYVLNGNLPNAGMIPVIGLNWRVSAMYCNWLHNGKQNTLESLQSGAYDVSTFHTNPDGTFTDQITRSPGATFWIPSLDEWIKAVHYDPNRYGPGKGGWWESPRQTGTVSLFRTTLEYSNIREYSGQFRIKRPCRLLEDQFAMVSSPPSQSSKTGKTGGKPGQFRIFGLLWMVDDDNPSATEPQRTLKITYPFAMGYEYTITPTRI